MKRNHQLKLNTAICTIMLMIGNCLLPLYAQSKPAAEFQVKAAFLYNFTRFIDWPPTAFSSANAPFVIAIIGNDPFGDYLAQVIKSESVNNHRIIIKRYNQLKEVTDCHILFISPPATKKTKEILQLTEHRNILTVSDGDNFTNSGGIVSFYKENNKIRFEINISSAKAAQLEISSKLLTLARISGRTAE